MNLLTQLWRWLRRLFKRESTPYRTVVVKDIPKQFRAGEIYLIGENGYFWCAALLCPCRCSEVILLRCNDSTM